MQTLRKVWRGIIPNDANCFGWISLEEFWHEFLELHFELSCWLKIVEIWIVNSSCIRGTKVGVDILVVDVWKRWLTVVKGKTSVKFERGIEVCMFNNHCWKRKLRTDDTYQVLEVQLTAAAKTVLPIRWRESWVHKFVWKSYDYRTRLRKCQNSNNSTTTVVYSNSLLLLRVDYSTERVPILGYGTLGTWYPVDCIPIIMFFRNSNPVTTNLFFVHTVDQRR